MELTYRLLVGDCRAQMATLPDASVDAIVTDPPYELGFMGKSWDASGIAYDGEVWRQALRVLKPGGHLLAFSGSRTYHRMVVAIEDAGFEIRDQIMWLYGSGFPKSHDVSKAIDKLDAVAEQQERQLRFTAWIRSTGLTSAMIDHATGTNMGGHYTARNSQPRIMTTEHLDAVRHLIGTVPEWVERECQIRSVESKQYASRQVIDQRTMIDATKARPGFSGAVHSETYQGEKRLVDITAPATPEAQQWQGWGTALKPAHEPICVARKPLRGTVAANVLAYGTGAINVDGCRVGMSEQDRNTIESASWIGRNLDRKAYGDWATDGTDQPMTTHPAGRWPANVIHDGSEEATAGLGDAARFFYSAKASKADRDEGMEGWEVQAVHRYGAGLGEGHDPNAPAINRNIHPTVKPTDLMRYLVRLVTPPGGLVLDPFTGSGSTGKAAVLEGFHFIGCELSPDYAAIAEARIKAAAVKTGQIFEIPASPAPGRKADGEQLRLFA